MRRRKTRKTKKDFQKMVLAGLEFIENIIQNGNGPFYMADLSAHIFQRSTTAKDDAYVRSTLIRHIKSALDASHGLTLTYIKESQFWIITDDGSNEIYRRISHSLSCLLSKNMRQDRNYVENHKKRHLMLMKKVLPIIDKARQDINLISK